MDQLLPAILIISLVTASFLFIQRKPKRKLNLNLSYIDPFTLDQLKFPLITSTPTLDLSIIIPAFNETKRLPKMLNETIDYLKKRKLIHKEFSFEMIVVDDGSLDKTSFTAIQWAKKNNVKELKVLTLEENCGKGGAVTRVYSLISLNIP